MQGLFVDLVENVFACNDQMTRIDLFHADHVIFCLVTLHAETDLKGIVLFVLFRKKALQIGFIQIAFPQ